jgi:hypothetical protein
VAQSPRPFSFVANPGDSAPFSDRERHLGPVTTAAAARPPAMLQRRRRPPANHVTNPDLTNRLDSAVCTARIGVRHLTVMCLSQKIRLLGDPKTESPIIRVNAFISVWNRF